LNENLLCVLFQEYDLKKSAVYILPSVFIVQFQKISILIPHRRDWSFLGGRGSGRPQKFKKMFEA